MIKIACVGDNVVDINYIDGIVNPGGNCVNIAVRWDTRLPMLVYWQMMTMPK